MKRKTPGSLLTSGKLTCIVWEAKWVLDQGCAVVFIGGVLFVLFQRRSIWWYFIFHYRVRVMQWGCELSQSLQISLSLTNAWSMRIIVLQPSLVYKSKKYEQNLWMWKTTLCKHWNVHKWFIFLLHGRNSSVLLVAYCSVWKGYLTKICVRFVWKTNMCALLCHHSIDLHICFAFGYAFLLLGNKCSLDRCFFNKCWTRQLVTGKMLHL